MADRISCNDPSHSSLITTVTEQSALIIKLFAKIQDLEGKLEAARAPAPSPAAPQISAAPAPNFAAPNFAAPATGGSYDNQQDYSAQAPSAYEAKRTQAQGRPCNYGANCTREQCWYDHPDSRSTKTSNLGTVTPNRSQPTGNLTRTNKQECRNGINCTRADCRFEHPPNWAPPSSVNWEPQPQPHQEPAAEAPAAEAPAAGADNWGPSGDLSSWGATSTNDWSTPVDNTWGAPAVADNGWGGSTDNSWNAPSNQRKPAANHSRSTSVSMSRDESVSNASTNRSQGRAQRGTRGKGRMADSGSVRTESTPMSPAALGPTPMSMHAESIPAQTPLSPPVEPTVQTSSFDEPNPSDEMDTPSLEPGPSSASEPEAPNTPKASWSDEPVIDVVHFPDPPPNVNESQPSIPEDQFAPNAGHESANLDQYAPSDLYSSWGVTGSTASDWGLDPTEFPDPTPTVSNKSTGKTSKSKGKQKETFATGTNGRGTPNRSSNTAAQSGTNTPANEPSEPERVPTPPPPQGVPHDEIPDWLLGTDEDAHAMLGIPRVTSPKPDAPAGPPRLASTTPAPRAPLSKLAGENFPTLSGILPVVKPSQSKDEAPPKPAFTPRPVGYKITRSSDTSSGWGKGTKSKENSNSGGWP